MKERITITLDKKLIEQLDKRIDGNEIKNRSQEIERILEDALGFSIPSRAIILAGGKSDKSNYRLPKALVKIRGKTVLENIFDLLKKYGIRDVIICLGYLGNLVRAYFGDGSKFGVNIDYVDENPKKPLGTGGAIKLAREFVKDSFIVSNCDELKDINIPRMFRLHKRKNALATIALTTVSDPSGYGVARLDGSRIIEFVEKPKKSEAPSYLVNSGFYILEPRVVDMIPEGKFCMLEEFIFPKLAEQGKLRGFPFSGQWFDISSSENLEKARRLWKGIN